MEKKETDVKFRTIVAIEIEKHSHNNNKYTQEAKNPPCETLWNEKENSITDRA